MTETITLLYFARLREAFGKASEPLALPAGVATLEGVRALLAADRKSTRLNSSHQ